MYRRILIASASLLLACSGSSSARDSDVEPDAGTTVVDAGPHDAGLPDAGCTTGQHQCGEDCVANDSPATCGSSCTPCPGITNGAATCDQGVCGVQCASGTLHCGDACVEESEHACGSQCLECTTSTPHSFAYCAAGLCGTSCNGDYIACDLGGCGHLQAESCESDGDCCTGHCEGKACCSGIGSQCQSDSDCTTYHCTGTTNLRCNANKCCLSAGNACKADGDCCSGTCSVTPGLGGFCKN